MPRKKKKAAEAAAESERLQLENLDLERKLDLAKSETSAAKRKARATGAEGARMEAMLGFREDLAKGKDKPSGWKKWKSTRRGEEACAIAQWSDDHCEENVDPESVEGVNTYTPEVYAKRNKKRAMKTLYLIENWRNLCPVPRIVVHLGGDHITGMIHEELAEENHESPVMAARRARKALVWSLRYLLEHGKFKDVLVVCNYGNHGRTTQRKRYGNAWKHSYEYGMFLDIEETFDATPGIEFIVPKSPRVMVDVYGYPLRFHHGDYAGNYAGGIGGKVIPVKRKLAKWDRKERAYCDFFGHFHEFEWVYGRYVANGSLIGTTSYGDANFEYQPPVQALSILDKRRGLACAIPIFVEKPQLEGE